MKRQSWAQTRVARLAILLLLTFVLHEPTQAQTFQVLHNFTGGQDGGHPYAGVTMDKAGNLYGTTYSYGSGYGTVYQLKHKGSGWIFNLLYSFTGSGDGANPVARVILGPNGTLYGTALGGGKAAGTVFNLRPPPRACTTALCPWGVTVLYSFLNGADGAFPGYGDLVFDQSGNIYGTTIQGGAYNAGTAYELTPSGSGWTKAVIYNFGAGSDGKYPYSGLIFDNAGNLYGTTKTGGSGEYGTVFQLMHSTGWTESLLYSFHNGSDGYYPYAGLIIDPSGNLYGTTSSGGSAHRGTVFELSPSGGGWTYTLLYSFPQGGNDGCGPWANLVMDGAGNLYGTTLCDGANNGTVFKLTPSSPYWTYTLLHDFKGGSDGGFPYSNVVFDANGSLYGTAADGGSQGYGVVWEITP